MVPEIKKDAEEKMKKTISVYREDLQSIRAGRANPSLLDKITVDYYGQATPLNQVAGISAPEPRLLAITPWDASLIPAIEKAILKSELGITPSNDGKIVRLLIPHLTEERRKELTKIVRKNGENAKVAIRNIRRDSIDEVKKLEKSKEISEDDRKDGEEQIQKLTDKYIEELDKITKSKEDELMEI
ncbi:ribosome recycling factor [Peptoniphilus sp. oral taxon 386]|uniref:ribosome recycling factor n=1 Tax=Peptoniphilus sp. oral taxon 386 TaxID=652713 RepID=UPI0001DA9CE3|nr:ribosome recycling factor [Peptoniphilus sp. oral taxon 386]EFI42263.1 ribosome recycling factor [Peptoniphilus sp. oral taxon 386 str. F0131]